MFEQVLSLAGDKTAIIISHRLSITPLADRILVLEHGRLIEEGNHHQLMEREGKYVQMYKTQAGMYWPKTSIRSLLRYDQKNPYIFDDQIFTIPVGATW